MQPCRACCALVVLASGCGLPQEGLGAASTGPRDATLTDVQSDGSTFDVDVDGQPSDTTTSDTTASEAGTNDASVADSAEAGCTTGVVCNGSCTTASDCSGCSGNQYLCRETNTCVNLCGTCPSTAGCIVCPDGGSMGVVLCDDAVCGSAHPTCPCSSPGDCPTAPKVVCDTNNQCSLCGHSNTDQQQCQSPGGTCCYVTSSNCSSGACP